VVAGVVPVPGAAAVAAAVTVAAGAAGALLGTYDAVRTAVAVLVALAVAELLLRHCTRRFGGVTGDVFGGLAETAATVCLLVLSLGQ
ncbi:adenosylcobinamide-GDP ribazoletransferase, partial [Streptomyces panaciradicis]|uniref:adenosylcobinamide-GDP ribazoletransferase n=1 Tax=Streptomyces panaciradicis TaxID=1470261 RepID=UPI00201CF5AC